jgi:aspartate/methionine/tyrosine aminotransferase
MERAKHYLSICNSAPSEMLSLIALKARETILEKNRLLVAANLQILERFMADHAGLFDWYTPDGGCIVFPRYMGAEGVEAFTARLVEEAGVLLLPSSNYHSELNEVPGDRFRIGFGRADFSEGIEAWRRFIELQIEN